MGLEVEKAGSPKGKTAQNVGELSHVSLAHAMVMFQSTRLVGCDRFDFIKEMPKGKDIHASHAARKGG